MNRILKKKLIFFQFPTRWISLVVCNNKRRGKKCLNWRIPKKRNWEKKEKIEIDDKLWEYFYLKWIAVFKIDFHCSIICIIRYNSDVFYEIRLKIDGVLPAWKTPFFFQMSATNSTSVEVIDLQQKKNIPLFYI